MNNKDYPQLFKDLFDSLFDFIMTSEIEGMNEEKARKISKGAAESIREEWGGSMIYIPMGNLYKLSKRDEEIYNKFNGSNHRQLSKDYDVSIQHVYRIIKIKRKEDLKSRQTELF